MKAILEFNLPEEQSEFEQAINAPKFESKIDDFKNWLRSVVKYGNKPDLEHKVYADVQEKLFECLNSDNE